MTFFLTAVLDESYTIPMIIPDVRMMVTLASNTGTFYVIKYYLKLKSKNKKTSVFRMHNVQCERVEKYDSLRAKNVIDLHNRSNVFGKNGVNGCKGERK